MLQIARKVTITLSYATAILIVGSCAKTENGGGNGPDLTPATVEVGPASPSLNAVGATVQLTATVKAADGSVISGASVTWAAASGSAASVSATGLVTAVANGTEQITATAGSASGNVAVTVAQVPAGFTKVNGDAQGPVPVATQLADDLVAQVNDANDNPIEGVALEFKVATGGGSVTTTTGTSDAMGQLSTTWMLGTTSGQQEVTVEVVANAAVISTFTADSDPDTPVRVAVVSGSGQSGLINQPLADPLVARIEDQYGNGVPGIDIDFTITSGGGSVAPAMVTTDQNGEASTVWTLGSTQGVQDAEAQDAAQNFTAVMFTAIGGDLTLTNVSPDPMVEGATATFTGTNFDLTLSNNTVMIDGVQATVTSVTPDRTTMDVTVPMFNCQPARTVDVTVELPGGFQTPTFPHDLDPDEAFLNAAVGDFTLVEDPANFCLQFAAATGLREYLVGVQAMGETPTAETDITLVGVTPPGVPFTAPLFRQVAVRNPGVAQWMASPQRQRLAAHAEVEQRIRAFDRQNIARMGPQPLMQTAARAAVVPGTAIVGDNFNLSVFNISGNGLCSDNIAITATVRAVGTRAFWLEDDGNPTGYMTADWNALRDQFDNDIYPNHNAAFGDIPDRDANSRVVIVITKEVNKVTNLLGFVVSCDLNAMGSPGSNFGEYFYGKAPDPTGVVNGVYTVADALLDAPFVVAHEYTHVNQQGNRLDTSGNAGMDQWMAEGQATLSEEIVGLALEMPALPAGGYGSDIARNQDPDPIDWFSNGFIDMGRYFGYNDGGAKIGAAPHGCGWLATAGNGGLGSCTGQRNVYGTPWSLLRYLADQYGGSYPGGVGQMQQDMIKTSSRGYQVLRDVLTAASALSLETVMAQWAAMLYVDDRFSGMPTALLLPTWNLYDIYVTGSVAFGSEFELTPNTEGLADFSSTATIRDGSTYYTLVSGTNPPATAIRARDIVDGSLVNKMQMWVVRTR